MELKQCMLSRVLSSAGAVSGSETEEEFPDAEPATADGGAAGMPASAVATTSSKAAHSSDKRRLTPAPSRVTSEKAAPSAAQINSRAPPALLYPKHAKAAARVSGLAKASISISSPDSVSHRAWSVEELSDLRAAHAAADPLRRDFWRQVATRLAIMSGDSHQRALTSKYF